ncbi:hypothetical protein NCCP2145_21840 [Pseudarthrobacter sp. NCCP-2145]|nr:hypothetical protein NCCP2145_21840 [Pseudarthrobacter sp. NCCP-2145]
MRAVGVSLVFVHHMLTPLHFGGGLGVDIFFVLSGYLITGILLKELTASGGINLPRFYIRRAIRLYPALLVALLLVLIPGLLLSPSVGKFLAENAFALTYTTPLVLEIADGASVAWRHTWTLGIEEMFYLAWPAVLLLLLRGRRPNAIAAWAVALVGTLLLLCLVAIESVGFEYGNLLLRSGGLLLGSALAIALASHPSWKISETWAWVGLASVGLGVALETVASMTGPAVVAACLGAVAMTAHFATGRSFASALFSTKPLAYLGRVSYELYLWHYPVLVLLSWAFAATFIEVAWIAAPLSILLATLTHRLLAPLIDRWKGIPDNMVRLRASR